MTESPMNLEYNEVKKDSRHSEIPLVKLSHDLTQSDKRRRVAFYRFSQGAMRGEVAIWVVGENGDRYMIQTDNSVKLPGRTQSFEPGQTSYVRKYSVVMAGGE